MGTSALSQNPADANDGGAIQIAEQWIEEHHSLELEWAFNMAMKLIFDIAEDVHPNWIDPVARPFLVCSRDMALGEIMIPGKDDEEGLALLDMFLLADESTSLLSQAQRLYLERLRETPFRFYQVTRVNPGKSLTVVDVMRPERPMITIQESLLSRAIPPGAFFGARLVDLATHRVLAQGFLPAPPASVTQVVSALEAMKDETEDWAVDWTMTPVIGPILAKELFTPDSPELFDDDTGEPLSLISDCYEILDRDELIKRLGQDPQTERIGEFAWCRTGTSEPGAASVPRLTRGLRLSTSILGDKEAEKQFLCSIYEESSNIGTLVVFYNTQSKAAQWKDWFEAVAGRSVRLLRRETIDPVEEIQKILSGTSKPPPAFGGFDRVIPPNQMTSLMQQTYEETYRDWATTSLPALNNKSPLDACKTRQGQERVRGIINMYVSGEANFAARDKRKPASFKFLWAQVNLKP